MSASALLAALVVGVGLSLAVIGWLLRIRRRQLTLAEMLALEDGERTVPVEVVTESPEAPPIGTITARAGQLMGRLDSRGSLTRALEGADIPIKAGEYLFLVSVAAVVMGALLGLVMGSPMAGIVGAVITVVLAKLFPGIKLQRRTAAIRAQLPGAFSLIASSVGSGHTFLRSLQILSDQIPKPLSVELKRVTAEVTLGSNLIDALEHMAGRVAIPDLRWAVKAVRIQQTTGGQLGEILHTLADFMRVRDDVHREVQVLAAEGKFSAYILMGMPVAVFALLTVMSPGYLDPIMRGLGWLLSVGAVVLMAIGYLVIRKVIKIDV